MSTGKESSAPPSTTNTTKVEVVNTKHWALTVIAGLLIICLLLFIAARMPKSKTHPADELEKIRSFKEELKKIDDSLKADIVALDNEIASLQESSETNSTSLKGDVSELKQLVDSSTKSLRKEIGELKTEVAIIALPIRAAPIEKPLPPPMAPIVTPAPEFLVNLLLVDNFGIARHCFKGVAVSSIYQRGQRTDFLFEGKPNSSTLKVMRSYPYIADEPPVIGAIVYSPSSGTAAKAINVPVQNVYTSDDGAMRYDDLTGKFPCVPAGAAFLTHQIELPARP